MKIGKLFGSTSFPAGAEKVQDSFLSNQLCYIFPCLQQLDWNLLFFKLGFVL